MRKSRLIMLRAWHNNQMVIPSSANHYGLSMFFNAIPDSAIVMEFTGVYDKRGDRVYEGDIVRDAYGRIMSILFHNYRLQFYCPKKGNNFTYADFLDWVVKDKETDYELTDKCDVEIIGNIYENPNLLTPSTPNQ